MLELLTALKQQPIGEPLDIEALSNTASIPVTKIDAWLGANAGRSIHGLTIVLMGGISAKPRYAVTRGYDLEKVPELKMKHLPMEDAGYLLRNYPT
jgi:hypothetical protein